MNAHGTQPSRARTVGFAAALALILSVGLVGSGLLADQARAESEPVMIEAERQSGWWGRTIWAQTFFRARLARWLDLEDGQVAIPIQPRPPIIIDPTTTTAPPPPTTIPSTTSSTTPTTTPSTTPGSTTEPDDPPDETPPTTQPRPTTTTRPVTTQQPVPSPDPAPVYRITNGSGRATSVDDSSPIGEVAHHGVRIYCVASHITHDDPIVFPDQPGAAHAHLFWGNSEASATSTGDSLLASGNSSCEGGTNNRSSYWIPALFNDRDEAILPETIFVYYKSFGGPGFDRSTIQPIPPGLQMLATRGVARARESHFRVSGSDGEVGLMVLFPECVQVDGSGQPVLSSADNVSHLSYAGGGGPSGCPSSHPYRIPQLSYVVRFALPFSSDWSLSSDHPGGGSKGHSLHADYIAAWDLDSMATITACVVVARRDCGFAGGRGQLPERFVSPDGTTVYVSSVNLAADADRTPFGSGVPRFLP